LLLWCTVAVSEVRPSRKTRIIANGHNMNAKSDLDKLSVAETAYYAEHDGYSAYDKRQRSRQGS
jgi:hypothetical protein